MWNVKIVDLWNKSGVNVCINRNIVECKGISKLPQMKRSICINRNIVECKVYRSRNQSPFSSVLIETLWNVKIENIVTEIYLRELY